MNMVYFIRLLLKHTLLLIVTPIIVVAIIFYFTKDEPKTYRSNASIYTGIATGSSIVSLEESKMDLFGTRTAFDNLINIITSRSTIEKVGLRLLASHLALEQPANEIIHRQTYNELMRIVPDEVKALVVKGDYSRTLKNIKTYGEQDHENFVYELLNFNHKHYSTKSIRSKTRVNRVQSSDMIDIQFSSDDPGICKHTLDILIEVFIEEYAGIKANQTDAVVRYFQAQIDEANERLNQSENELLQFNRSNNIVNYYEQTKHIASEREQANLTYMDLQMSNAAAQSSMKALESRMSAHEKTRLNSTEITSLRNQLAKVNFEIALKTQADELNEGEEERLISELAQLQTQSYQLQNALSEAISQKYNLENTKEGVASESILNDWLKMMLEYESTKAKLQVGNQKQREFRELFENYAPLGATMKRLERKIDVAEREYLSLLHSLNLAKLKQQNIELNSNLKIVAAPFFPIVSEPSKRKFLLVIGFLIGFLIPAFTIIVLEFLDQNIRNSFRAESLIGLNVAAIFPVLGYNSHIDFEFIKSRGLDFLSRRLILNSETAISKPKPDINLIFSTLESEGKTFLIDSLHVKLNEFGYKVLLVKPEQSQSRSNNDSSTVYYHINNEFHRVGKLTELEADWSKVDPADYDYIFVEIPGILNNSYPIKLFKTTHHSFLVTRANRPWSKADKHSLKDILEFAKENKPQVLLNGTELDEMETVLGDLPKHRTFIRRFIKNLLRLQFFSKRNVGSQSVFYQTNQTKQQGNVPVKWLLLTLILAFLAFVGLILVYPKYKAQKAKQVSFENFPVLADNEIETKEYPISDEVKKLESVNSSIVESQIEIKHQVVVGVFRSNENARQYFYLYKQFGFEPTIIEITGGLYRVIVGSYNLYEEAEKIRKEVNDFVPHADASIIMVTETTEQ